MPFSNVLDHIVFVASCARPRLTHAHDQELQIMAGWEMALENTHTSLCYLLSISFEV